MFKYIPLLLVTLFWITLSVVHAGTIHKWVDENGVTHYSDQAPLNNPISTNQIDVSNVYSDSDYKENYYSITNQWARMREERLERKKLQLEKVKQKAALKQAQAALVPHVVYLNQEEERSSRVYYPAYRFGYGHHGFRNKHHKHYSKYSGGKLRWSNANRSRTQSCKLPRRSNSRYGSAGLTLTFR